MLTILLSRISGERQSNWSIKEFEDILVNGQFNNPEKNQYPTLQEPKKKHLSMVPINGIENMPYLSPPPP